jgi:hypothetical protein
VIAILGGEEVKIGGVCEQRVDSVQRLQVTINEQEEEWVR